MPCWSEVLAEINAEGVRLAHLQESEPHNLEAREHPAINISKKYHQELSELTGRYTISYGSAWLQKPQAPADQLLVMQADMDGFLEVVYHAKGQTKLDLILHSPGGSPEAAEQIITYLREKFDDIRVIVPLQAMSAATMMALASNCICMARHSSLGPTDPQFMLRSNTGAVRAVAAHSIQEEFSKAKLEASSGTIAAWAPILAQYPPGIIAQCEHSLELTQNVVTDWLSKYMFKGKSGAELLAKKVAKDFAKSDHHTHGRPLMRETLREWGLTITDMESNQEEQELIMSCYHALTHLMGGTGITKAIQSSSGNGFYRQHVAESIT